MTWPVSYTHLMHAWQEPFERIAALAAERGVALTTPEMGERLDLNAPHPGGAWWRAVAAQPAMARPAAAC